MCKYVIAGFTTILAFATFQYFCWWDEWVK